MNITFSDLRDALQSALGAERAEAAIHDAADALHIDGPDFTRDQALAVLGKVAEHDGLVGISARFARSRMMTRWATAELDSLHS